MENYAKKGTGSGRLYPPVDHPPFTLPEVLKPLLVRVDGGRLWAPPSTHAIVPPSPSAWRNFADTDPKNVGALRAIATEYGPLTVAGATEDGESLAIWRTLIRDLHRFARAWTVDGAEAAPARKVEIATFAMQVQDRLVQEHMAAHGRFASYGSAGFGMVTREMDQWWRLSALASVYAEAPFRRCRFCHCWFTMKGRRSDAGYCSERHRVYAGQGVKIPSTMGWWGLV
jgi:hypothetical protein